jgi:hypothetical protein
VKTPDSVDKAKPASLRSDRIPAEGRDAAISSSATVRREAHLF